MKFLRGKVWQIALALCILVALLCITASATEEYVAELTIVGQTVKVGGASPAERYFFTDENGALQATDGENSATANNYNVKLAIVENEAVLYLKGAKLVASGEAYGLRISSTNTTVTTLRIVVEGDREKEAEQSSITSEAVAFYINKIPCVLEGSGKLTVESTKDAFYLTASDAVGPSITFKDLELNVTVADGAKCITGRPQKVTFEGNCNATLSASGTSYVYYVTAAVQGLEGIEVKDNADVTMEANGATTIYSNQSGPKLVVNGGSLKVTSTASGMRAVDLASKQIVINGGTVELDVSGGGYRVGNTNLAIDMNGYTASYSAVAKTSATASATTYDGRTMNYFVYFKVEPLYTVTVDGDGTATLNSAPADGQVSLSAPATNAEGKKFAKWTSTSEDVTFADPYSTSTTFNMPAHDVTVTATYGAAGSVTIGSTSYQVVQGGKTYYFTTPSGVITAGGDESTYNIKFVYPADGTPTLYLKGAYVTQAINSNANSAASTTIIIEKADANTTSVPDVALMKDNTRPDSYMTNGFDWQHGELIIQGVDNSLFKILRNGAYAFTVIGQPITFKDLQLDVNVTGSGIRCIAATGARVTFDNCTAVLHSESSVAYAANDTTGIPVEGVQGLVITNGADVTMSSTSGQTIYSTPTTNTQQMVINSGKFKVLTASGSQAVRWDSGNITINGGVVEFSGKKATYSNYEINLSAYGPYYASVSSTATDGTDALEWNRTTGLNNYKYFKVEPAYTIAVEGGAPSRDSAPAGMEVTLTAEKRAGYGFSEWTNVEGFTAVTFTDADAESTTFIMPAGNVSIKASFAKKASVTFGGSAREVTEGKGPAYFTTLNGQITAGGNESTYNIKFDYPKDGKPTLYLKGAHITDAISSNANSVDTVIVIQKAGNSTTVPVDALMADNTNPDSYMTGTITWSHSKLEIQGFEGTPGAETVLGKFKMLDTANADAVYISGQQVTFKNLNLEITVTQSGQRCIRGTGAKIIFEGGKAVLNAEASPAYGANTSTIEDQGLVITDNADVTITNSNNCAIYSDDEHHAITVNSGKLTIKANAGNAVRLKSGNFTINGGIVEISSTLPIPQQHSLTPTLTNYDDDNGDTYYASVSESEDGTGATEWDSTTELNKYKYFKVEPAYNITVKEGEGTASVTKAPAGMNVTLTMTLSELQQGQGVAYWWSEQVKDEAGNYVRSVDNVYTFTMPSQSITIKAEYGTLAEVYLNGSGTPYSVVQGGATKYYITNDETGAISAGDSENYNIAFTYLADDGNGEPEQPTLILNDATLNGSYNQGCIMNGAATPDLVIEVHGQKNNLRDTGGRAAILFDGDNLTINGTDGNKMNVTSSGQPIYLRGTYWNESAENHILTLNNVNIEGEGSGTGYIRLSKKYDVEINGGSVNIVSQKSGFYFDHDGDMRVYNAQVFIKAGTDDTGIYMNGGTVSIVDSTLNIGTEEQPVQYGISAGNLTIEDSEMEIFATKSVYPNQNAPTLDLTADKYVVVAAESREAFMANPDQYLYEDGSALNAVKYFLIEPKQVKVTITWGAMSFTYNGSIWNVDTHSWEGNWTPTNTADETQIDMWWNADEEKWDSAEVTDAEPLGLASNQIRVENTGTDTVDVRFTFATADTFIADYEKTIIGTFTDGEDTVITDGTITLVRFAEADAFLNLTSAAIASDFGNTTLGTVTVVIDALRPAQGGNA